MTGGIATQLIMIPANHPIMTVAEVILEVRETLAVVVMLEEVAMAAVVVTNTRFFVQLAGPVNGD